MNLLLQLLIAAAIIAALILLRVFANRRALRQKLMGDSGGDKCSETECSHNCREHNH